ncbi:hypothetical protein ACH3XW_46305 [Acanthocheilonema viteae]
MSYNRTVQYDDPRCNTMTWFRLRVISIWNDLDYSKQGKHRSEPRIDLNHYSPIASQIPMILLVVDELSTWLDRELDNE